jgi:hypothetical protein
MPRGSVVLFDGFMYDLAKGVHGDLSAATLKLGIIDDTAAPAVDDANPRWADYVANEVVTTGNYTANGETLTTLVLALISQLTTLSADDVGIALHASGFLNGYSGILYNSTAANDEAIGFIDLDGPVSEQEGPVDFEWAGGVVAEFPANVLTWS